MILENAKQFKNPLIVSRANVQYYDDIPVKNTDSKRQPIRFRDAEKISKKKEHKNAQKRLTKRKWLDYNSPRDTSYDD